MPWQSTQFHGRRPISASDGNTVGFGKVMLVEPEMKIAEKPLTVAETLLREPSERRDAWAAALEQIEGYYAGLDTLPGSRKIDLDEVHRLIARIDFGTPVSPLDAIRFASEGLTEHQVHTTHTGHFGLFNPAASTMGVVADALVAAFNPQLAAWTQSVFANEVERRLVRELGVKFGYREEEVDGTFCSGGAEANHTALIAALTAKFPTFASEGVRSLAGQPTLYVSQQAHHSFVKAARFCGLGSDSVRQVPVDANACLDPLRLAALIEQDLRDGFRPFMVVATFGTTNAGVIDPVLPIRELARRHALWFHVDAAWGGLAAFVPELRGLLEGVGDSDSITFDAHKSMSVPMGAGIFLTRHSSILGAACRITTDYMPPNGDAAPDPYTHSLQWSRRFIGLKLFMSLAVAGWDGYAAVLRHQTAMANELRDLLREHGWRVVNDTPLPTVCFVEADREPSAERFAGMVRRIVEGGKVWISTTRLAEGNPVLRACVTNFRTERRDLESLIDVLEEVRLENGA